MKIKPLNNILQEVNKMFNRTRIIKRIYPSGSTGYFIQKQNPLFFWLYKDCHFYPITLDEAQKNEYIFKPFKNRVVEVYKKIKFRVVEQYYSNGEFRGFFVQQKYPLFFWLWSFVQQKDPLFFWLWSFVQQKDPLFFWLWRNCHAIRYENADVAKNNVTYWHNRSKEIVKELAEAKKLCHTTYEVVSDVRL